MERMFATLTTTVLEQLGTRMKVAQELLRHADIQTTMNVYTGAMEKDKRSRHSSCTSGARQSAMRGRLFVIEPKRTEMRSGQNLVTL
jgi:hypothetical protein